MAEYRLSNLAVKDLEAIADFSINRFGIEQARRYRDELIVCFRELSDNPKLGRRAEHLARNLRCHDHRSHTIYYRISKNELIIVRVLHSRMDTERHI